MRIGIPLAYTVAAILVMGILWPLIGGGPHDEAVNYYFYLYFGALLGISMAACCSPFSPASSLLDTFVELVEAFSAPIGWLVIIGGAIGWVCLVLFLPLIGALIIELARRVFLPTANMAINDWIWLLSAIVNGGVAAFVFWPLRALFD